MITAAVSTAVLFAGVSLSGGGTSGAVPIPASGSAFGVGATGLVEIVPTPTAPSDATLVGITEPPFITTGVLNAKANLDGDTFTSSASVADLSALIPLPLPLPIPVPIPVPLPGVVTATAEAVGSTCTTEGGALAGDSTIADLAIAGVDVDVDVLEPNTDLTIPGVATIILNEQTTSTDGQTLTVNAIRINLLEGTQEVIVAQSVCTLAGDDDTTSSTTPDTTSSTTPDTTSSTTPDTTPSTTPAGGGSGGGTGGAPGAVPVTGNPNFTG